MERDSITERPFCLNRLVRPPQNQIQAFRTFQISEEFRECYGNPETTPAIRRKVFGLNVAVLYGITEDETRTHTSSGAVVRRKENYRNDPQPHYLVFWPKIRREFLNFLKWS